MNKEMIKRLKNWPYYKKKADLHDKKYSYSHIKIRNIIFRYFYIVYILK
jgi:hypothetical protein